MTQDDFLSALSSEELRDFFYDLDESTQHEIFTRAVVEGCSYPDDEFFYASELDDRIEDMTPREAFELGKELGNESGKYFHDGIYGIEFFDDAEAYMLDYLDEMADYIRENYADELAEFFEFEEDEEEEEEESEE